MTREVIEVPPLNKGPLDVVRVCKDLLDAPECEELVLDLERISWTPPFAMLMLARTIKRLANERRETTVVKVSNHQTLQYAAHMGMFRDCGLRGAEFPFGPPRGSKNYVPISLFRTTTVKLQAAEAGLEPGDVIERKSTALAEVLTQERDGDAHETLSYCVRELVRNAYEHSGSFGFRICGQYWPTIGRTEIVIADEGEGILTALSENPKLELPNDRAAIQAALLPGVSGTAWKFKKSQSQNPWRNSGYGLYMTHRICSEFGALTVASGDHAISISSGSKKSASLNVDQLKNASEMLKRYAEEGREQATEIAGAATLAASAASTMVSVLSQKKKRHAHTPP